MSGTLQCMHCAHDTLLGQTRHRTHDRHPKFCENCKECKEVIDYFDRMIPNQGEHRDLR